MTNTLRAPGAQARRPRPRKSHIPEPFGPGYVSVSDGQVFIGTIVEADGSHFAFDHTHVLIGEYKTRQAAMRSLPGIDAIGEYDPIVRVS
jgi:hypothetical protein